MRKYKRQPNKNFMNMHADLSITEQDTVKGGDPV